MRVAFTGKGGSGKTTISSLFAQLAASDGYRVLAMDADINQHMASALGHPNTLRSMGTDAESIKSYLRGSNELIDTHGMHKTTPPGTGSSLVRLAPDDWFVEEFAQSVSKNLWVAGAGEIPEGNVGVRCYHGLNGAVELVLGHMLDKQEDIVAVDMTAGADAFSSSLFTKVDVLVLVVEPTLKSLSVYGQFKKHANDYGIPIIIVANKVQDEGDKVFIADRVGQVDSWIGVSAEVRRRERGEEPSDVEADTIEQLRQLRERLLEKPIDWRKREELSYRMHRRAVTRPAIDASFSLERAAAL